LPEPLAAAVARLGEGRRPGPSEPRTSASSAYRVSGLSLRRDRAAHEAAVARTIEYIRAGDIFQANMTRPIRFDFRGSSRALFRQAAAVAPAWYGAYLELPNGRCLLSLSPELYLQVDADGAVQTRPIKGTRPAGVDAAELRASEKDAAELNMIIDLSRNDLGRVCELGSVRVSQPREVETHPTVHHGVATIEGRLREGCGICDLLAASFPGGSITGAPKIRAMQIIEELETTPRGPYCGAIGFLDDAGAARLNIAIRTLTLHGSTTAPGVYEQAAGVYSVGGGIVADSDPAAEYEETVAKAAVLQRLAAPLVPYDARAGSDLSIFSETACPGVDLPL
jgi:para-aminobenzoate synthetase component 1